MCKLRKNCESSGKAVKIEEKLWILRKNCESWKKKTKEKLGVNVVQGAGPLYIYQPCLKSKQLKYKFYKVQMSL